MRKAKEHVEFICDCRREGCVFCGGGLFQCTICGAAEGELLRYCPGYRLNNEAKDACYTGNVIDLPFWQDMKKYYQKNSYHPHKSLKETIKREDKRRKGEP